MGQFFFELIFGVKLTDLPQFSVLIRKKGTIL
jgi:hypothetical protein